MFKYAMTRNAIIIGMMIHLSFHVLLVYGIITFSLHWLWLTLIGTILIRHIGTEIGAHRYYTHQSFKANPWAQWLMSILFVWNYGGSMLAWCPGHSYHHRFSDSKHDIQSPHYIKKFKDFVRVVFPAVFAYEKLYNDEIDKMRMKRYMEWFHEKRGFMELMKNKPARFTHNYYWLIVSLPIIILPIIDIRLLIFLIAIPCVINFWSLALLNFFGHISTIGSYKNFETDEWGNKERSVNTLWLNIFTGGMGLQNNHHHNSRAYNFKMNDKWHETDFLNVFLIEKFLKV